MAKTLVDFSTQQAVYQSALRAGANIIQPSLIDFLSSPVPDMEVNDTMQIQSTRFGKIDIADDAVIEFPDGIIGLPGTRYALVAQQEGSSFFWLHSIDDPSVALPVTQPWLFFPSYEVRCPDDDAAKLASTRPSRPTSSASSGPLELEDFTVNLAGRSWSTPPAGLAGRSSTRPATTPSASRSSPTSS